MPTASLRRVLGHLRTATGSEDTDAQLLESFLTCPVGDAIETIVRRHGPMVFGVCLRVLGNVHDAEDAFQATFLVFVRKAAGIVPREKLANWLYGVAHRTALAARTAAVRRRQKEGQATTMLPPEPADEVAQRELLALLDAQLARLPDRYRLPVVLCDLEGRTRKEAARQLGWPEGTLSWRLAHARDLLARRLGRAGVTASAGVLASVLAGAAKAVPPSLLTTTVRSAVFVASGAATWTTVVPGPVVNLTQGVLKAMLLSKLKIGAAGVVILAVICAVPGLWAYQQLKPAPKAAEVQRAQASDDEPQRSQKKPARVHKTESSHHESATAQRVTHKVFKTGAQPRIQVEVANGNIDVAAGAGDTVDVHVTAKARADTKERAEEALRNIDLTVEQDGDTIRVRARQKPDHEHVRHTNTETSARLRVPAGAKLNLKTSNGKVNIEGATGSVEVHTSNGAVGLKGGRGDVRIQTSNGTIQITDATGRLDLNTSNGHIDIQARKAMIAAHSSNGEIRFEGSLAGGHDVLQTTNGSITLVLPADASFRVDARTNLGHITSDFDGSHVSGKKRTQLHATIGKDPSEQIELRTTLGSIHLRRQGQAGSQERTRVKPRE